MRQVSGIDSSPPDPLAVQMAQLLSNSEVDELREVVRRWVAEAPSGALKQQYERFGGQLIELKQALAEQPFQPSQQDLEFTLTMMLQLAATSEGAPRR